MSYKPKTRVAVQADGSMRELFSVRERSDGYLLLIEKASNQYGLAPEGYADALGFRTSIHPSPKSELGGFTIKNTLKLATGETRDTAAFVVPVGSELIWPLMACRAPDLTPDHYQLVANPRDTLITLPAFHTRSANLIYVIVLTDANTVLTDEADYSKHGFTARFRLFNLSVFYMFMNAPSFKQGDRLTVSTSAPRANEIPMYDLQLDGVSMSRRRLDERASELIAGLRQIYVERLTAWMRAEGETLSDEFLAHLEIASRRLGFEAPEDVE